MSALADPGRAPAPVAVTMRGRARATAVPERPLIRLATFTALAGWGMSRWATLMRPAPGWRLVGLLALAVALAGGVRWLSGRRRWWGWLACALIVALAFPVAGLPWSLVVHLRVARSVQEVGRGLSALPAVLVPYLGRSPAVRLDILLGAAVLGLDAAAVLAFAGRPGRAISDGRRAAAALPLVALAIVPGTLVHPKLPYLQGLLLFGLIAALVWGERVRAPAAGAALAVLLTGGLAALAIAPRLDEHRAWVNYRAWAGAVPRLRLARFDWNQTYGPLRWPHTGHVVMTVTAARPDYWKAEDLDEFDGVDWRYGISAPIGSLPAPSRRALAQFSQTIQVNISGMQTPDVISAGVASAPRGELPGGYAASLDAGSWVADQPLGSGTSYQLTTYSPAPTEAQLAAAGRAYPAAALDGDLTLEVPDGRPRQPATLAVRFPVFGTGGSPSIPGAEPNPVTGPLDASAQAYVPASPPARVGRAALAVLDASPYARVYALARRLARGAGTPEAYVQAVMRYLGHGFTYDQNPPASRYPLATFLLSDHRGYCQQFSGAMALLLRMGGVPARVASGFTSGTRSGHRFIVTDLDAHAWVEVWFPGWGWVRRDPTPAADPALSRFISHTAIPQDTFKSPATPHSLPRRPAGAPSGATSAVRAAHHHRSSGSSPWPAIGLGALAGLLVLLGVTLRPRLAGALRPVDPVAELERAMRRSGRPLPGGCTLSSIERRVAGSPEAAAYVRALRTARYRGGGPAPSPRGRRALRRELGRGGGWGGRLRGLWALPPRLAHRPPGRPA
jgi:transglutaminase-like putative cysteine protease